MFLLPMILGLAKATGDAWQCQLDNPNWEVGNGFNCDPNTFQCPCQQYGQKCMKISKDSPYTMCITCFDINNEDPCNNGNEGELDCHWRADETNDAGRNCFHGKRPTEKPERPACPNLPSKVVDCGAHGIGVGAPPNEEAGWFSKVVLDGENIMASPICKVQGYGMIDVQMWGTVPKNKFGKREACTFPGAGGKANKGGGTINNLSGAVSFKCTLPEGGKRLCDPRKQYEMPQCAPLPDYPYRHKGSVVDCGYYNVASMQQNVDRACKNIGVGCVGEGWLSKVNTVDPMKKVKTHTECRQAGFYGAHFDKWGVNGGKQCRFPGPKYHTWNKQGGPLGNMGERVTFKCWGPRICTPADPPTAPPTSPPTAPPTVPPTAPPTAPPTSPPTAPPTVPPTVPPTAPPTVPPTDGVDVCLGLDKKQCRRTEGCKSVNDECKSEASISPCDGLTGKKCGRKEGCYLKDNVCVEGEGPYVPNKKDCKKAGKSEQPQAECEKLGCKYSAKYNERKGKWKIKCKAPKN